VAQGRSINIGLNKVDPRHYSGWDGQLNACEFDAEDMKALAESKGFSATTLLSADATVDAVTSAVSDAAAELQEGDVLLLSYSGHGGQVPDLTGEEAEDRMDETWCLFDRQFLDDELYALWQKFQPGVRIILLSDSCHSGTVLRLAPKESGPAETESGVKIRALPEDIQAKTDRAHREEYAAIQKAHPTGEQGELGAKVLLLSGCKDEETSRDGSTNGLFTGALLQVWDSGNFEGDYEAFHAAIGRITEGTQTPQLNTLPDDDTEFKSQQPFSV
jgi:hypothetical protein